MYFPYIVSYLYTVYLLYCFWYLFFKFENSVLFSTVYSCIFFLNHFYIMLSSGFYNLFSISSISIRVSLVFLCIMSYTILPNSFYSCLMFILLMFYCLHIFVFLYHFLCLFWLFMVDERCCYNHLLIHILFIPLSF